jgi:molybdopterin converting factor subunit 1
LESRATLLGNRELAFELSGNSVGDLRNTLATQYPDLKKLKSLFIAVNQEYASDEAPLHETDEIALIPPVSGG